MQEHVYWLALSRVEGMGPRRFHRLLERFGSPRRVWECDEEELRRAGDIPLSLGHNILRAREGKGEREALAEIERLAGEGVRILTLADPEYPVNLRSIHDPPPVLYLRGNLQPGDARAVSLVGTRRASSYGLMVAETLGRELAAAGVTVVSGLARGVDTAAHRGALGAGGRTIAVLGCGLDRPYPPENRRLLAEIARQGAALSEYPPGTPPLPRNFPARNRIISGLSLGTVVVEAGEKSGALITADFALEQGREVLAVPGPVTGKGSRGTNRLIKQGARLVEEARDILEELGLESLFTVATGGRPADGSVPGGAALTADERQLLDFLASGPLDIEELACRSGLPAGRLNACLIYLEIKGLVRQLPGKCFIRVP